MPGGFVACVASVPGGFGAWARHVTPGAIPGVRGAEPAAKSTVGWADSGHGGHRWAGHPAGHGHGLGILIDGRPRHTGYATASPPAAARFTKVFLAKAILHVEARVEGSKQRRTATQQGRAVARQRVALTALTDSMAAPSDTASLMMAAAFPTTGAGEGTLEGSQGSQGWGNPQLPPSLAYGTASAAETPGSGTSSGTVFSAWAHRFFPAILDVLVPGGADDPEEMSAHEAPLSTPTGASLPSGGSSGGAGFHYVLRDLCVVLLTAWGGVFEKEPPGAAPQAGRQAAPRRLLHHGAVAPAATRLLRHLVLASPSPLSEVCGRHSDNGPNI